MFHITSFGLLVAAECSLAAANVSPTRNVVLAFVTQRQMKSTLVRKLGSDTLIPILCGSA
jgi:hypothetical protein